MLELSVAVKTRRVDMGLTQTSLARLSGLSRATVNQVETGTIKDLSLTRVARLLSVLGLSVTVSAPREWPRPARGVKTPALVVAARTASVSYRTLMRPSVLHKTLTTGVVASRFVPHVRALLEEASPALLASVVEQMHFEAGIERATAWTSMRALARQFKSRRELWQ